MGNPKYIFVTGGVTSSLGKGIISASLGKLLQSRGFSVTIQKFDPYINIDPGTLNPYEHGECYVTDDGAETDLDLGHYERFLGTPTSQANNVTTGRIYNDVINKERKGDFLGKTVQVVPHITDEIKRYFRIISQHNDYDIIITELGGCVGDIESLPFIEAMRQYKWEMGSENVISIHLTLVPYLKAAGELKTKPTQHSVKALAELGIQPDILVCRSEKTLPTGLKKKVALFCSVDQKAVISAEDAPTIYDVPLLMKEQKLDELVLKKFQLSSDQDTKLENWKEFLHKLKNPKDTVTIGLVGKYVELPDAYKSIAESFIHAGAVTECKVKLKWIQAEHLVTKGMRALDHLDGILVAPGFGERGMEGKIRAVQHARENRIPVFGICLGMQCMVIEYGRNVLGLKKATTSEINPRSEEPVIDMMADQKKIINKGGTMRLGAYVCELKKDSLAYEIYGQESIKERHRHRYEFNNDYLEQYHQGGMVTSGINPKSGLVEIVEVPDHPHFIGVQFHPELKSTVINPHPLFVKMVSASLQYSKTKNNTNQ